MNRRTMLLAGFATLPAAVLPWPRLSGAQRRRRQRPRGSGTKPVGRRQSGDVTASRARTRTVTRTFSNLNPISLPAGAALPSLYPSLLQVGGFRQGRIRKVRVTLFGLSNSFNPDFDIMVVAPGNVGVILMSDVASFGETSNLTIVFAQDAAGRLPNPLASGTFQPTNSGTSLDAFPPPAPAGVGGHSLTRFTNRNPNGFWQLFVVNDNPSDSAGSLSGWSLTIQALVRVPPPRRRRPKRAQRHPRRGGR
jgi:hypothetical protein